MLSPVFVIGEVIIEMLIPYLVGILIDNGIMKGNMAYISKLGLLLFVLTIVSLALGASASYVSAHAAAGFAANLRKDMFYHMQDYSFENIDHFSSASLVTRLTTDVNNVQLAYQMLIRIAVRAPMMFIVSIIMSVIISPRLSLIFLVLGPIFALALGLIIRTAYPYFPKIFRGYDRMNQVVRENVRGHIVFDHVNFSYVPKHQILHDISINAKPGMKVALVGETGAGKTTISNMLNRFYEIDSGKITYDGIPIKDIKKDDLRQSLSIVLQETHLFTGTIMDNIRFGNPEASDDDVYQAAKLSHADEFIHDLDHGYQTVIDGNGGDLSQGQMQLLSIARAMIADEPVMILDEATSSIDTRTEKMVQAGMDNLLAGRTSFVIAHRLSTIVNSDLILVLDHGHIIEEGNHEQLLKKKGYYYELYTGKKEIQ